MQYLRTIACLPTGGGKTKVFIDITKTALEKGTTVLILSESSKIYGQIQAEAKGVEIKAGCDKNLYIKPGVAYVAMAQTLRSRTLILAQFIALANAGKLLMIVDEAHVGTCNSVIEAIQNAYLIGFTATPDARVAKHLPKIFKDCVVGAQVTDIIQDGFLTPYRHYARVGADMNALQLQHGDFSEASQAQAFERTEVYKGLEEDLRTLQYRKAIIFCSSIDHCQKLSTELTQSGFNVVQVHSKQSDAENTFALGQYMKGDINICVTVGILTKGFDFWQIDLVVLQRATTSLPLYLQMCGRGSRIVPYEYRNQYHKPRFTVLDYGENYKRHGLWDMDRDWSEMWHTVKKKRDKEGVAPVKTCPNCEAILPASSQMCMYCNTVLPKSEKELKEGQLIEITEAYQAIVGRKLSSLSPTELALYAKVKNRKPLAIRVARSWEQREPGYLAQFATAMGYSHGWLIHAMPPPVQSKADIITFTEQTLY